MLISNKSLQLKCISWKWWKSNKFDKLAGLKCKQKKKILNLEDKKKCLKQNLK